MGKNKVVPVLN